MLICVNEDTLYIDIDVDMYKRYYCSTSNQHDSSLYGSKAKFERSDSHCDSVLDYMYIYNKTTIDYRVNEHDVISIKDRLISIFVWMTLHQFQVQGAFLEQT